MQDDDGLIAQCLARNPRARKRLREVAWEEIWAVQGKDDKDYSTLPKELWGMIAARCDVSRATLTTLLLLNKERISAVAWVNFRFPPTWDYRTFTDRFFYDCGYRKAPGWTEYHWTVFGYENDGAREFFRPIEQHASAHVAHFVWAKLPRDDLAFDDTWHIAMRTIYNEEDVLKCISKLLNVYRPCTDYITLSKMFKHIGCTSERLPYIDTKTPLKNVPAVLDIKTPLTNVHVALGYYNAYREYARADYGVRLPKIELKGD